MCINFHEVALVPCSDLAKRPQTQAAVSTVLEPHDQNDRFRTKTTTMLCEAILKTDSDRLPHRSRGPQLLVGR